MKLKIHNRNIRSTNTISVTHATKTCRQNALFYRGIQFFKAISNEIRENESFNKFEELDKRTGKMSNDKLLFLKKRCFMEKSK